LFFDKIDMKYYSIHFNRPDFVEIQFELSKKHNYDLVVVNNGCDQSIKDISDRLGVEYIETQNVGGNGSLSHGSSINQIISKIDMSEDWGLLDHDMFMTTQIDFSDCDIITMKCDNIPDKPYLWPGMLICKGGVDLSGVDFRPGVGIPADTGSATYEYVNKYNVKWCSLERYGVQDNRLVQDSKIITGHLLDGKLIGYHYLNGSNWTGGNAIDSKNDILRSLIK
jgi:hypothetical protein